MRSFGMMAMTGVVGLLALKLLMAFVFPALIGFIGLLATIAKWGIFLAIGYFLWNLFRGRRKEADATA